MYRNVFYMMLFVLFPLSGYAQSDIDIDFDNNGVVDEQDLAALTEAFGTNQTQYDLYPDGVINFKDLIIFASAYNQEDTSEVVVPITEEAEEQEASARVKFFELSTNSRPNDLAIDPRGYIWFTEVGGNAIGRLEPRTDMILRFSLTTPGAQPHSIVLDSQGHVWFTEIAANRIGMLDPFSNDIQEFTVPTPGSRPISLKFDDQGMLWFIESAADRIARLDPVTETIEEFSIGEQDSIGDQDVALGSLQIDDSGQVWFVDREQSLLGTLDPDTEEITTFSLPGDSLAIGQMGLDSVGKVWFTDSTRLGMFDFVSRQTRYFRFPEEMESPYALNVDSNDRVWVGGQSSGWLVNFSLQDTTFTLYEISDDDVEVKNLRVDPRGVVWIVDPTGNQIGRIETSN